MNNKYSDNLVNEFISPDVLAMLDKDIMEKRFMMPLSYDKDSHTLTVVTSHFEDNFYGYEHYTCSCPQELL